MDNFRRRLFSEEELLEQPTLKHAWIILDAAKDSTGTTLLDVSDYSKYNITRVHFSGSYFSGTYSNGIVTVTALSKNTSVTTCRSDIGYISVSGFDDIQINVRLLKSSYPSINGYEYETIYGVNVALKNIGASNPYSLGDYYAWGETETKDSYTWGNYKYGNGSSINVTTTTKYNSSDGLTVLQPEDDAATVNWGSGWRIPTKAEAQCIFGNDSNLANSVEYGSYNGNSCLVRCYGTIRSSSNEKVIMFPAITYQRNGTSNQPLRNSSTWRYNTVFFMNNSIGNNGVTLQDVLYAKVGQGLNSTTIDRYLGVLVRPVADI